MRSITLLAMHIISRMHQWGLLLAPWLPALPADTDPTGVSAAFTNLARLFAGVLAGVVTFFVVVEGFLYITAIDDVQKATHAKRALGTLLFGAILVALAVTIGPQIVDAITGTSTP